MRKKKVQSSRKRVKIANQDCLDVAANPRGSRSEVKASKCGGNKQECFCSCFFLSLVSTTSGLFWLLAMLDWVGSAPRVLLPRPAFAATFSPRESHTCSKKLSSWVDPVIRFVSGSNIHLSSMQKHKSIKSSKKEQNTMPTEKPSESI